MERTVADGRLSAPGYSAGDYDYWIATRTDEPIVRDILARVATGGRVQLSFQREPDAFAADFGSRAHHYILARNRNSGEHVGLCERVVRDCYVNGAVRALPYLAGLRVVPGFRHRLLVLRGGFEAVRRLLGDGAEPAYALTSIMSDNAGAQRLLGANLKGLPRYEPVGELATFALAADSAGDCERATRADLPEIAALLGAAAARTQFASCWTPALLESYALAGWLRPEDYLLARRGGRITACAALWDQSARRQVIVAGYSRWLRRVRPLVNLAARVTGAPRLPRPGGALRCAYLSHVAADDPAELALLVAGARAAAARRGLDTVLAGWDAAHPLAEVFRTHARRREYRSRLYLVRWPDAPAPELDTTLRVAPELALL